VVGARNAYEAGVLLQLARILLARLSPQRILIVVIGLCMIAVPIARAEHDLVHRAGCMSICIGQGTSGRTRLSLCHDGSAIRHTLLASVRLDNLKCALTCCRGGKGEIAVHLRHCRDLDRAAIDDCSRRRSANEHAASGNALRSGCDDFQGRCEDILKQSAGRPGTRSRAVRGVGVGARAVPSTSAAASPASDATRKAWRTGSTAAVTSVRGFSGTTRYSAC